LWNRAEVFLLDYFLWYFSTSTVIRPESDKSRGITISLKCLKFLCHQKLYMRYCNIHIGGKRNDLVNRSFSASKNKMIFNLRDRGPIWTEYPSLILTSLFFFSDFNFVVCIDWRQNLCYYATYRASNSDYTITGHHQRLPSPLYPHI
jgi:hypothetical protein